MRLIDADALKESFSVGMINGWDSFSIESIRDSIDEAPTIEPNQWISTKERMPKESEVVMIAGIGGTVNIGFWESVDRDKPFVRTMSDGRKICFAKPDGGVWWRFRHDDAIERQLISHWMPLPKPPKKGAP